MRSDYSGVKVFGMILLADVWVVDVADLVFIVEIHQQTAVSDRNISHLTGVISNLRLDRRRRQVLFGSGR